MKAGNSRQRDKTVLRKLIGKGVFGSHPEAATGRVGELTPHRLHKREHRVWHLAELNVASA